MYRLSLIISEIYNKYLPLAEKEGIILNLDFSDTTKEIADPDRIKQYLDDNLSSTLKRSDRGEVTIGVDKTSITITDSATTLSHTACALLSNRYIDVSSRVGFGTTVKIFLQPRELPAQPTTKQPALKVEGVGVAAALDNEGANPTFKSEVKVAAKQGQKDLQLGAKLKLKGKSTMKTSTKTKVKATKLPPRSSRAKPIASSALPLRRPTKKSNASPRKPRSKPKNSPKPPKSPPRPPAPKLAKLPKPLAKRSARPPKISRKMPKRLLKRPSAS